MNFNKNTKVKYIIILFYLITQVLIAQNSVITESLQEFKTYPFYDPDPVANIGNIYPYFKFDGFTHNGELKKWKVVTLENPYIKVFVMPEIGGKIWGAMDKATGKMFIYYNHVVKFRNVAMRGPWTSGGIEINFGFFGHAPTCSTPVDYTLKKNDDGSVSCIVGSMDLPSRTTWNVEIRLPKDKAYFETNLLWHNSTGISQSYYHWMNGAARAADDLKFFFPGHHYISHSGVPYPWSIDEKGHNISVYKENNFGTYKSYHVLGEYTDFWGGYYFNDKFGFGHWSNYTDKPGKKIWIWGLSRQGMIWEDLLTDTDGQYVEIQTGRLFNQAADKSSETPFKHREFLPYSNDTWKEIWFPVKETGGIKTASPYAVLNVENNSNQLKVYLNPLQKINDTLTVKINKRAVYKKPLSLNPLELFVDSLKIDSNGNNNILIQLGMDKLRYSNIDLIQNYLHRPLNSPQNFDWTSLQGLSIKAKEEAKKRKYKIAKSTYLRCLSKDPNYIPALNGIAELNYRSTDYDSALIYVKRVLSIDTYNGKGNFIYGLINREKNLRADAKDGFSIAAHSIEYRSSAFTKLAEMYAEEKLWKQAADFAQKAIDYNKYNLSAYEMLCATLRKQNRLLEGKEILDDLLKINPLSHFAEFEKYLLQNDSDLLQQFKQQITGEFPEQTFIELAIRYFKLGLIEDAITVLYNAPDNPIVTYWQAYLLNKNGENEKSKKMLNKADTQSINLIFPFRSETVTVLNWAKSKSNNWKVKYYLALIYWNKGKIEKAQNLFSECKEEPETLAFYLNRGKIFEKTDPYNSLKDYQYAVDMDKTNWRAWLMLADMYDKIGNTDKRLIALETIFKQNPKDYRVSIPYSKALYESGKYSECVNILEKAQTLPKEGMRFARILFNNAHIMLAIENINKNKMQKALVHLEKSKLWPENLGSGKPYNPDEIFSDYLELDIREKIGNTQKITEINKKINAQLNINRENNNPNNLIVALVLKKEGDDKKAIQFIKKWAKNSKDDDFAQWALALSTGDERSAEQRFEKIKNNPYLKMFFEQPIYNQIKNFGKY